MRLALAVLSALLLPGSPQTGTPVAEDRTRIAIVHQLDLFAQRMHDKQEEPILASYSPNAVFEDPSGQRFSTPAQRRKLYDQVFAVYDSDLHFGAPTIVSVGHSVHISGTYTESLRDRRTGKVQQLKGGYRFRLATFYNGRWEFTRMQWTFEP